MSFQFVLDGAAAEKLSKLAKDLNVPVEVVFERALANGVYMMTESSAGREFVVEDKKKGARWRVHPVGE
jgi:predicted transcriptional regulator